MLKETPRTLRAFFILSGILGVAISTGMVWQAHAAAAEVVLFSITASFSVVYLFIGVWFRRLLRSRPGLILGVLRISLVFGGLGLAGVVLQLIGGGSGTGELVGAALQFLFVMYLLTNVKRLAAEVRDPQDAPAQWATSPGVLSSSENADRSEYSPE